MSKELTHGELTKSLARSEASGAASRRREFEAGAWLKAVVENSDDAILSKTLDGIIMTWSAGAERLFGYKADEAIGQHITIIIPDDRLHEEQAIIETLRSGTRIEHFETVRRSKDGSFVEVALTVSPVKDEAGIILGASKIVRDISAAKEAANRQDLILREMNHRIKNLFSLTASLIALSARATDDAKELAKDLTDRLQALSRAHSLILPDLFEDVASQAGTTLPALIEEVLAPHRDTERKRTVITGEPVEVGHHALPTLSLLLHELATNAAKYGALSSAEGRVKVEISTEADRTHIRWIETGGPPRCGSVSISKGFGSRLEEASVRTLRGGLERIWRDDGLEIAMDFPLEQVAR